MTTEKSRPYGALTEIIRVTCDTKNGAAMAQIREAIDRDSQRATSLVRHCLLKGIIFKAGVRTHLRYFLNPADRDAFALVAQKLHDDERKVAALAKKKRRNEWRAARQAAKPKKEKTVKQKAPKEKKAKLKKLPFLLQRNEKTLCVKVQITWPEHVQVQRIPTPVDTRFTFIPSKGWQGAITQDWMNRRFENGHASK